MIKLNNISKVYNPKSKNQVEALKKIDLQINRGEIFGIIGLSGAGKSTLIRLINMLEKPTTGQVFVDNLELTSLSDSQLRKARRSIGMIFQNFNLLSSATVADNVAFPLTLDKKLTKEQISSKVSQLLELVGLKDKANMYPAQLSGGQKQRVGIARALAMDPKVLLCDEATSALDPKTTSSILKLLVDLKNRLNLTIVLITHQMEVIKDCCDRVAVIDKGYITELGNTIDIFTNPKEKLTKRLVSSVVRRGLPELLKHTQIYKTYSNGDKAVVELLFLGDKADAPVIVEVAKLTDASISILAGSIDHIQNKPFGLIVVEIAGNENTIHQAIEEFKNRVFNVEILGYDRREQLA